MMDIKDKIDQKLNKQAGIAIGPILFIVAILGVLAAAISAGGSGFSGQSSTDSAKTKAGAMIDIGQNLRSAATRIMINGGYAPHDITVDVPDLTDKGLFSATGGTLSPPSNSLAAAAADYWSFVYAEPTNIGSGGQTAATSQLIAMIIIPETTCNAVNSIVTNSSVTAAIQFTTVPNGPPGAGAVLDAGSTQSNFGYTGAAWPTSSLVGCVTDGTYDYFYQFIATI